MKADDIGACLRAAAIAVTAWFVVLGSASAQDVPGFPRSVDAYDAREIAMLPGYCTYTQGFRRAVPGGDNPTTIREWEGVFGPTFIHMHHYCLGLMKTNRATLLSRDPITRRFYLNDAITEYDYVITRAPADFVLMPEMYTKKAQNLVLLGQGPAGVAEYLRAIDAKNDYWPPYAYLSDYYVDIGDKKKATEILNEGLARVPNATALQRRLAELDQAKRRKQ